MNDARPVWITEQEAEIAAWLYRRWEAAPANAANAIAAMFNDLVPGSLSNADLDQFSAAVLRTLGMPDA